MFRAICFYKTHILYSVYVQHKCICTAQVYMCICTAQVYMYSTICVLWKQIARNIRYVFYETQSTSFYFSCYGVATVSRLLKMIGLFCRISSLLQDSFAKETYDFQEPTDRSHPISVFMKHLLHESNVLQRVAALRSVQQCVAVCCGVRCCSVLLCVAVC